MAIGVRGEVLRARKDRAVYPAEVERLKISVNLPYNQHTAEKVFASNVFGSREFTDWVNILTVSGAGGNVRVIEVTEIVHGSKMYFIKFLVP